MRPAPYDNSAGLDMIKRYSDHAANERTFLAWVRTAIAVMAFGFLIERFDLFLLFATQQTSPQSLTDT
jgi:putative membrane protein